jgi:hypothetical protein
MLGGSSLEEAAGVNWATLRRKRFLLAEGSTRITVLATEVIVFYRDMQTQVFPKTVIFI